MKGFKGGKFITITCPVCEHEYSPNEIYVPTDFFNQLDLEDKEMDLKEHYICDYCNTPFNIKASIRFSTEIDSVHNFNEDYSTSLVKNSLFLDED